MDETRLRAVMREEIALAMKTLESEMYSSDPEDDMTVDRALSSFNSYAYAGACEEADKQHAENATNPFAESSGADETTEALKVVRGSLVESNAHPDHTRRMNELIEKRERSVGE